MHISSLVLIGSLFLSSVAQAQISLESFSWRTNSRFDLQLSEASGPMELRGELQDGATQSYPINDVWTAEIKSYTSELFVVIAITSIQDETGYVFFLERPEQAWILMNERPLRARKLDLMKDFEGVIEGFKQVSNFGLAQSLRKMVEFTERYPEGRLQDVYNALERGDNFVMTLPRLSGSSAEQYGIVRPDIPGNPQPAASSAQPQNSAPSSSEPSSIPEEPRRNVPAESEDAFVDFPSEFPPQIEPMQPSPAAPSRVQGNDPLAEALRRAMEQN